MSNTVQGTGVPRNVSREPVSTVDRPSNGMPCPGADKIFTRGTTGTADGTKDGNFARSFHHAQTLYQQFRRTFDPNHGVAPGQNRSTFYMKEELPPLDPSRYQAVITAATQANQGRSYQRPATTGPTNYTRF